MKSKKIICGAVAAALTLSVAFSGCGLLSTNNEEDMKQTIATVNIGKSDKLGSELSQYASAISDKAIIKRELVNAFINVGSNYVNSYGYEGTFNMLLDELTNNALIVQYSTLYVLKSKVDDSEITLAEYAAKTTEKDKLIYLLGGETSHGVLEAQYNLYSSLNSAIDSYEELELEEGDEYVGTDTRTTPDGIDNTVDEYLPLTEDGEHLDYGVYTGYDGYLLADAGKYEPLDNTNRNTRRKAYSRFLTSIKNNYLLSDKDTDLKDVMTLTYVQNQLVSQLQQAVVEEFYNIYTKEQQAKISMIDEYGEYSFLKEKYDGLLEEQSQTNKEVSTFESAMGAFSDTSFVLYAPTTENNTEEMNETFGTFGYVYNILLPFSVTQSNLLTQLQSRRTDEIIDESGYFVARNELMRDIVTTDQREAWFNGSKDYSFNAAEYNSDKTGDDVLSFYNGGKENRKYLFFENNLTKTSEYKPLEKYIGKYSYNGTVSPNKDGSYTLVPAKLNIDDMLEEFSAYINYVLGKPSVEYYAGDDMSLRLNDFEEYYRIPAGKTAKDKFIFQSGERKGEIDYSKLVYATGRVNLEDKSKGNMFVAQTDENEASDRYLAMAAVNELQYAYTTDTGVLSQYIGYTVSAYDTNYIKEFEYAAQQALRMGVGAFKVCAGDYGWHLIYVTDCFSFEGGEVYSPQFTKERIEIEGTFENIFFEWIKGQTLSNEINLKRTEILQYFSNDTTITKHKKAYKDLLELG